MPCIFSGQEHFQLLRGMYACRHAMRAESRVVAACESRYHGHVLALDATGVDAQRIAHFCATFSLSCVIADVRSDAPPTFLMRGLLLLRRRGFGRSPRPSIAAFADAVTTQLLPPRRLYFSSYRYAGNYYALFRHLLFGFHAGAHIVAEPSGRSFRANFAA